MTNADLLPAHATVLKRKAVVYVRRSTQAQVQTNLESRRRQYEFVDVARRRGYRTVISVLKNPFYAGAYAYGKSKTRSEFVDGRARKSYGHRKPFEEWEVLLKDHHEGYIDWTEFERNQKQLAVNAYGKAEDESRYARYIERLADGDYLIVPAGVKWRRRFVRVLAC